MATFPMSHSQDDVQDFKRLTDFRLNFTLASLFGRLMNFSDNMSGIERIFERFTQASSFMTIQ